MHDKTVILFNVEALISLSIIISLLIIFILYRKFSKLLKNSLWDMTVSSIT